MTPNQAQLNNPQKKSKLPYIIGCSILFIGFVLILVATVLGYLYFSNKSSLPFTENNSEYFGKISVPKSQTLRYGVNQNSETNGLDPHTTVENKIMPALFDGLAEYSNEKTTLTPSLATKWEMNSDATVWKFYLRKDAKWSDGKPITAKDFVYSWKRLLDPEIASLKTFLLYDVKNAENYNTSKANAEDVGIEAIDDYTLQVTMEKPTPYFDKLIADTALRPVPQETIEKYGNDWTSPQNIVSSGAFKLVSPTNDNEIRLVKNEQFWDSKNVKLESIIFYTDNSSVFDKYENGEIDAVEVSTADIKDLSSKNVGEKKDFSLHKILGVEFIFLNTNNKPLDNAKVRKALSLAIDRKELNERGINEFPTSVFVPKIDNYEKLKESEFDPAKAKQLLSEAGYPNGEGLPEIEYAYNTAESNQRTAEFIQDQWQKNLGVKTKLKQMEWKTYLVFRSNGEYTGFARGGWIGDFADPYSFLSLFTMPDSIKGWDDEKYKSLIEKANSTTASTERYKILAEAESYLLEQQAIIPLSNNFKRLLSKPYIEGIAINPENKINWREVSIDTDFAAQE